LAITPDGKHVYVANRLGNTVSVITTATGAVSVPITVGTNPTGVAICPP
jgi:YVTN family beta-propeller protein